jgi:hypothetical protein
VSSPVNAVRYFGRSETVNSQGNSPSTIITNSIVAEVPLSIYSNINKPIDLWRDSLDDKSNWRWPNEASGRVWQGVDVEKRWKSSRWSGLKSGFRNLCDLVGSLEGDASPYERWYFSGLMYSWQMSKRATEGHTPVQIWDVSGWAEDGWIPGRTLINEPLPILFALPGISWDRLT